MGSHTLPLEIRCATYRMQKQYQSEHVVRTDIVLCTVRSSRLRAYTDPLSARQLAY